MIWLYLFYLTLLIFPFGQLVNLNLSVFNFPFKLPLFDIFGFLFVLYWLVKVKKTKPPFFVKPMLVFLVLAIISFAIKAFSFSQAQLVISFFYLFRLITWFIFPWAFYALLQTKKINTEKWLLIETLVLSVISIGQYLLFPDTRFFAFSNWDDHLFRAIGSFLDPSFNSLILVLGYIGLLKSYLQKKGFKLILLFLPILAIGLSFSRMAYLLFLISSLSLLLHYKKNNLCLGIVLFFILLIGFLPKPTGEGVDLTRDWQTTHAGSGADNSFLFVLVTTGIFGLISYLYFWGIIVKKSLDNKKAIFFLTTNICLLLSSFFINSLFYPWIWWWWGLCLANFTAEIHN